MAEKGKNLREVELQELPWGEDDLETSIHALYDRVQRTTLEAIDWYMARKRPRAMMSQALRLGAIFFATIGGVVPLLRAAGLIPALFRGGEMGQLGYVAFALAAGCVAVDRFFGLSTAWMRYITSAFALQRALAEFQFDWALFQVQLGGRPPTRDDAERMVLRLKQFRLAVFQIIERETQSWVAEFQSSLAELHKVAQAKTQALEPGCIDVSITNALECDGEIRIDLDGVPCEHTRASHCQLVTVAPGHHTVTIHAVIDGAPVQASGAAHVPSGGVTAVTLTLPRRR